MSCITEFFDIAGITLKVTFEQQGDDIRMLPTFVDFSSLETYVDAHISVTVGRCTGIEKGRLLDRQETPIGSVDVERLRSGYRCMLYDKSDVRTCVVEADDTFAHCRCELYGTYAKRCEALKDALLMIFSAAASFHNTLIIHSSVVNCCGRAYCFLGRSGTGKSTQADLWVKNVEGTSILNDDGPILQLRGNKIYVSGSPWSGKRNYCKNEMIEMGAMVLIDRAEKDSIDRLTPTEAFAKYYSSCSCFSYDSTIRNNFMNTYSKIISVTPSYVLHCLPDATAALLCSRAVAG